MDSESERRWPGGSNGRMKESNEGQNEFVQFFDESVVLDEDEEVGEEDETEIEEETEDDFSRGCSLGRLAFRDFEDLTEPEPVEGTVLAVKPLVP